MPECNIAAVISAALECGPRSVGLCVETSMMSISMAIEGVDQHEEPGARAAVVYDL